jgi:hypothetical protein
VRAHRDRPRAHGHVEHPPRARADVVDGERALGLGGDADRLIERARGGIEAVCQHRLVEVNVRIHEAGGDEGAVEIDRALRRPRWSAHGGDVTAGDGDVGEALAARDSRAAQQQVGGA